MQNLAAYWCLKEFNQMIWLKQRKEREGRSNNSEPENRNESSVAWQYSHAAILIEIPPRKERQPIPEILPGAMMRFSDFHKGNEAVERVNRARFPLFNVGW